MNYWRVGAWVPGMLEYQSRTFGTEEEAVAYAAKLRLEGFQVRVSDYDSLVRDAVEATFKGEGWVFQDPGPYRG